MKKGIFYERPDKYKFSTVFASEIKPITNEERDKYLSLASKQKIKELFPEVDLEKNEDLLGVWGAAFIGNRINANDDGVTSKDAVNIAKLLKWKFLDSEHIRSNLLGFIINTSYSEFGTNKQLTEDEVLKLKSPFYVNIAGLVWKVANPKIAEFIESTGEPDSSEKLYWSWELGFSETNLILLEGNKKNTEDGEIINDESKIQQLEGKLKSYGGSGKLDDGRRIARLIVGDILPLGVGAVSNPAADVPPIEVNQDKIKINIKSDINVDLHKKDEKSNSHTINNNVNPKEYIKHNKSMTLKSLTNLKDEDLKEATASEIVKAHKIDMDTEVEKISKDWEEKKNKVDNELKASNDKLGDLQKKFDEGQTKLNEITENLNKLVKANQDREQEEIFNTRMNYFDAEYDLSEEKIRNIVARKIKNVDEKTYAEAKEEIELLLAAKKKSGKVFDKKTMKWVDPEDVKDKSGDENKDKKQAKASTENKEEKTEDTNTQQVVDDAIDKGEKTKTTVAATTTPTETQTEKWAKAFGEDGWEIDKRAFRK